MERRKDHVASTEHPSNETNLPPHQLDALVRRVRDGDGVAFGILVSSCYSLLLERTKGLMGRTSRVLSTPEDVLQDSVLAAMGSLEQIRATGFVGFKAWMLGIIRNQIRHLRRSNRERVRPRAETALPPALQAPYGADVLDQIECSSKASPEHAALCDEDWRALRAVVNELTWEQSLAIVLRDSFQLSWRTIALVLDHPTEEAARKAHYRAGLALRRRMQGV